MSNLVLKKIKKVYPNGFQAVHDFNMAINDGEFIVFVGPSGCGKSTTLRMIAGLEEITEGSLLIDGMEAKNLAPKDRDIAFVFQNYALYSHFTVYHNMAFSLLLRKVNSNIIHEKVLWAADLLGLTPYLNRKPAQLSGGQRQRVALGRAIVRSPKIFLLDEPLSNLDAKLRGSMRKELKDLHDKLQATMIYVTHDQVEALTLADRIVIMNKGYIMQIGTPIEIYEDPKNIFVATFIGNPPMNIIKAKVLSEQRVECYGHIFDIKANPAASMLTNYQDKEIILGIRPEHIQLNLSNQKDAFNAMVEVFELLGSDALVYFHFGDQKVIAKFKTQDTYKPGDLITVSINAEVIHLFDDETKERIYGT